MKTQPYFSLLVTASLLAANTAKAQGGPPPPPPSFTMKEKPKFPVGDLTPLGIIAEKFLAFQRLNFLGEGFFKKEDDKLMQQYAQTYRMIVENVINERLSTAQGLHFTNELIAFGREMKNSYNTDTNSEDSSVKVSLDEIQAKIKEVSKEETPASVLTPDLNRVENQMSEIIRFVASDDKLSNKTDSLKRRLGDLLQEEDRAKQDDKLTDSERQKLIVTTGKTWNEFVHILIR